MFESKEEKKRKATRERVQRYREKKKGVTNDVTPCNNNVTNTESVTQNVTQTKMICRCRYYTLVNGERVCIQCGKPAPKKIEDKIRRGISFK
jgi:aminopeptidase C